MTPECDCTSGALAPAFKPHSWVNDGRKENCNKRHLIKDYQIKLVISTQPQPPSWCIYILVTHALYSVCTLISRQPPPNTPVPPPLFKIASMQ